MWRGIKSWQARDTLAPVDGPGGPQAWKAVSAAVEVAAVSAVVSVSGSVVLHAEIETAKTRASKKRHVVFIISSRNYFQSFIKTVKVSGFGRFTLSRVINCLQV